MGKSISSYRHNGDWPEQASQFNWSLVYEKQTEERNWSWSQSSFKDYKAVVHVQSCAVLTFEFLAKYIPHLSSPIIPFQCFLPPHVFRRDNQLWKCWWLWCLREKLNLLQRFLRKIERLGEALWKTVWSPVFHWRNKYKAEISNEQKHGFIETGQKAQALKEDKFRI